MLSIKTLLPKLKNLVTDLGEDLLARATNDAQIDAGLRDAFQQIEEGGRTAQAFEVWREDYLDQVAVAWVLACVFVRFMEDNHLIDECWLAGEGERRKLAEDTHELFFREHPHDTDREYFQHVFHEVGKIPAARDLFAEGKTPLWAVAPSGDAAMSLLKFWREMDAESGQLKRSFQFSVFSVQPGSDVKTEDGKLKTEHCQLNTDPTRFLGDLYQELSERAKKKYALLQTPVFVEEFILDRTLTPAIDEFGLDTVRMIDPTCGSGHFLLGGFARLFDLWSKPDYTSGNAEKDAQKALDGVWGVDINPFAVAIARFRLIASAVQACGIKRLKQAPGWMIHLASGDSLLFGNRWDRDGTKKAEARFLDDSWAPDIYACEEKAAVQEILGQQYHAVVGNPPYIIVRDRTLNAAYRDRYAACEGKYSLAVPFAERFVDLTLAASDGKCGYFGQITANSFMKREFGKKLIETFFPTIDLTHVIDTSGAYIPGHGTPTVILIGRNRRPTGATMRAVLGIKGEPSTPEVPSQGKVWQSIVRQVDRAGSQDDFTSTADVPRTTFNAHPWSIGGGGASDLQERLDEQQQTLGGVVNSIGFASFPGLDDAFIMDAQSLRRKGVDECYVKQFVFGETVRDWGIVNDQAALAPYTESFALITLDVVSGWFRHLWQLRTSLENIVSFGGRTRKDNGDDWWGWYRWIPDKYRTPLSITFAEVATHNHFVLDRGGKVFKQTAPIIKLPAGATEDEHLELVGLLNSSTGCFWLKQSCHNKGSTVDQHGARQRTDPFEDFYQFNGTRVGQFPIPAQKSVELARELDRLAQEYASFIPEQLVQQGTPAEAMFHEAKAAVALGRMIALQEEIDWQCYQLYGLTNEMLFETQRHREHGEEKAGSDSSVPSVPLRFETPSIQLGERAFEIVMARQMAAGELQTTWFDRHGSKPITELPAQWPDSYRKLVERRIELIETNKSIGLIEKPEYKRRWNQEPWDQQQQRALRNWLLDRLESQRYWPHPAQHEPRLRSVAELADRASGDHEFLQVAAIYRGRQDFDVVALVAELVANESVPFLPLLRYKASGLRKRKVWERTWDMQRQQDAGEDVGEIPVPPKYATADFLKTDYWRLRGKLDVPKERWISYPHCSTESDPTLVVGWAGWNHLQQATALVGYYDARKREGWDAKRLTPLLAGLDQLLPWIHQWHPEIDPEFGETAGQSFQTMLGQDAHELGLTREEIRAWEPPQKAARNKPRKTRTPRKKEAPAEGDE